MATPVKTGRPRRPRVTPHPTLNQSRLAKTRLVKRVRTAADVKKRAEAAHKTKVDPFRWTDPYPEVPGTLPEKMVYAALMHKNIPFQFQQPIHFDIPLVSDLWHRADFILPYEKLIIDVNGFYFHSKPAQIDKDSTVAAFAELSGWRVTFWWDFDIYADLDLLFLKENLGIAHLQPGFGSPGRADKRTQSDATGVRTLNKRKSHHFRKTRLSLKYVGGRKKRTRRRATRKIKAK